MDIAFNPANYPTYNIGDKVTIRQWDDMASEFGLNVFGDIKVPKACFTESMRKYCGKTLTIVRKNHYLSPNSDCYYFGGSTMVFTSPMFEQSKLQSVPPSSLSFDDLLKGATAQLANPQP